MPDEEFRSLIRGYIGKVMVYATARRVVVLIDKVVKFQESIASSELGLIGWPYRLKRGERCKRSLRDSIPLHMYCDKLMGSQGAR